VLLSFVDKQRLLHDIYRHFVFSGCQDDAKSSVRGICKKLIIATSSKYKEIETEKPVVAANNTINCN
jgi:hypothetical protein